MILKRMRDNGQPAMAKLQGYLAAIETRTNSMSEFQVSKSNYVECRIVANDLSNQALAEGEGASESR